MHSMLTGRAEKLRRILLAAVIVGSVTFPILFSIVSATSAAAAAQTNTYSWPAAPCTWTGQTTGTCSDYDWGLTTCPSGDGYCADQINGYYQLDNWGYQFRNCTSYVAEKISQVFRGRNISGFGDASQWATSAQHKGYHLDSSPEPGDIAVWGTEVAHGHGHVAYVYAVSNGVAKFDEYNVAGTGQFTSTYTSQNHPGPKTAPDWYIHMGAPPTPRTSLHLEQMVKTPTGPWQSYTVRPDVAIQGTPSTVLGSGDLNVFAVGKNGDLEQFNVTLGSTTWNVYDVVPGLGLSGGVSAFAQSDGTIQAYGPIP